MKVEKKKKKKSENVATVWIFTSESPTVARSFVLT